MKDFCEPLASAKILGVPVAPKISIFFYLLQDILPRTTNVILISFPYIKQLHCVLTYDISYFLPEVTGASQHFKLKWINFHPTQQCNITMWQGAEQQHNPNVLYI